MQHSVIVLITVNAFKMFTIPYVVQTSTSAHKNTSARAVKYLFLFLINITSCKVERSF